MDLERRRRASEAVERATELPMLILAVAMIPLVIAPFVFDLQGAWEAAILAGNWFIWAVFAVELVVKTYLAAEFLHELELLGFRRNVRAEPHSVDHLHARVAGRLVNDADDEVGALTVEAVDVRALAGLVDVDLDLHLLHRLLRRALRGALLSSAAQAGQGSLYHSGDTLWYQGMVDQIRPYEIDVAMLPINGRDPKRKVAGNLGCVEAARLGVAIRADLVIPCHYDMFTFNTANPKDFKQEAKEMGQSVKVLAHGERLSLRKVQGSNFKVGLKTND